MPSTSAPEAVTQLVMKFPAIYRTRVHKILTLGPIPINMYSVYTVPPHFSKIHSNIILPSTPWYSKWHIPLRFSNKNFVWISRLSYTCYMPLPTITPTYNLLARRRHGGK